MKDIILLCCAIASGIGASLQIYKFLRPKIKKIGGRIIAVASLFLLELLGAYFITILFKEGNFRWNFSITFIAITIASALNFCVASQRFSTILTRLESSHSNLVRVEGKMNE